MSQKIKPTARQKSIFFIHLFVFLAASAFMLLTYDKGATSWAYPWPAWIVAAWGLAVLGHGCTVFTSYEDPGMNEYQRQSENG